jgi:cell division protein FtsL
MGIPGWDSVAGASWWGTFWFWASIGSLLLLGVSEVISHRYTERKDFLAEREQTAEKQRHDEEMARLHLETRKAEERTAAAELELAKLAPRHLTQEQATEIGKFLREKFPDLVFAVTHWDQESNQYAMQFCAAAFGAGPCQWKWLDTPHGSGSALSGPAWTGAHKVAFLINQKGLFAAPEIRSDKTDMSDWPDVEKRGKELLGPLGELGFMLAGAPMFPEFGNRPVLYIAPKPPTTVYSPWPSETANSDTPGK